MIFPIYTHSELERTSWVTYSLIALNILVFGWLRFLGADDAVMLYRFGYIPEDPSVISLFSYMFIHAGWIHLAGNLYFLWIFGRAVEDRLGPFGYALLYLSAGVVSVLIHSAVTLPEVMDVPCVGASGAISGILGAFMIMFPGMKISSVVFLFGMRPVSVVQLPSFFVLGLWFVLQLIMHTALGGIPVATGVAYGAHIGGFLYGWLIIGALEGYRGLRREWEMLLWVGRFRGIVNAISAGEPVSEEDRQDARVQKLLFLKNGERPDNPDLPGKWIENLDVSENAGLIASLILRVRDLGLENDLSSKAVVKGAEVLADMGMFRGAVDMLCGKLLSVPNDEAQVILYSLGNILLACPGFDNAGLRCMREVIDIGPDSPLGASARYMISER